MQRRAMLPVALSVLMGLGLFSALGSATDERPDVQQDQRELSVYDRQIGRYAERSIQAGRLIFRYDTFGSEAFWGDTLRLHEAIAGAANGGAGSGLSPKAALAAGLKVDGDALPGKLRQAIKSGQVNLDDPAVTLALLKLNAVLGVTAFTDQAGNVRSVGFQCALCHSTVDDSFAPGVGKRLDGWANRDLNVGLIVSLALP